ncbi:MAG: hypothetical protein ACI90U_000471 [Pseudomonadales bacterium]
MFDFKSRLKNSSSFSVSPTLQEYINNLTIPKALASLTWQTLLIDRSPQVMQPTIDFYEDFINGKCIAKTSMFSFKLLGIFRPKLINPKPNRFLANDNSAMGK